MPLRRDCVEHFLSGQDAWKLGVLGALSRLRGLLGTIVVVILTSSAPWWWPQQKNVTLKFSLFTAIASGLAVSALLIVAGLIYLRWRTRRSLDIKHHLHGFAHHIRDAYTQSSVDLIDGNDPDLVNERLQRNFRQLLIDVCDRSQAYFRRLVLDDSIAVAIRLATVVDDVSYSDTVYSTVARSSGLSASRKDTSEPISPREGVARFLLDDHHATGVLIYNDLQEASRLKAFKRTRNEELYSGEVSSMMVAPLNGWDGTQRSMFGMLFVTSRKRRAFSAHNVDSLGFVADATAHAISALAEKIRQCGREPRV